MFVTQFCKYLTSKKNENVLVNLALTVFSLNNSEFGQSRFRKDGDDMFCRVSILQVDSVTKKEKAKQRPLALNTVEMLRVGSSSLGSRFPF